MKIQNTSNVHQSKVKACVFGEPGMGKTTLAGTLKGKTLIISSESGLLSLEGSAIDFVDINTDDDGNVLDAKGKIERLGALCKELNTKKDYENIFIDSVTEMSIIFEEYFDTLCKDEKNGFKKWGDYGRAFGKFIKGFRDLAHYNVIFVALRTRDKDEKSESFGAWVPEVVGKSAKELIQAAVDELFMYTFDKDGNRVLVTQKTPKSAGKDRSGKLDQLEKPDLQAILDKIQVKKEKKK